MTVDCRNYSTACDIYLFFEMLALETMAKLQRVEGVSEREHLTSRGLKPKDPHVTIPMLKPISWIRPCL